MTKRTRYRGVRRAPRAERPRSDILDSAPETWRSVLPDPMSGTMGATATRRAAGLPGRRRANPGPI